ncbi:trehalose-6-phosphate synthase [Actinokineospora fastidiosa]|uniref:Trehalose-6-phosphate synthase n=1 Tax=Actinokineospora fastidiosa TaxID=1816 RepID=A0A918LGP1_9PSEU|nr:trehalose-6-phosphate synthase [Actinokineospora fastidiosa]GGS45000.1 hypothetical protein GCM10010171_44900 [Actinokineospora fastidiosa]
MLSALLDDLGGAWFFSATGDQRPSQPTRNDVTWFPVTVSGQETSMRSRAAAIKLFLWTFHYLHDTSVEPAFDARMLADWRAYQEVNAQFGDALARGGDDSADEVVLVHDFHLMLVPGLFRSRLGRRNSTLVYFHHVPWCDPGYFGLLPDEVRGAVLRSLLSCDVVGFHSSLWAQNFMRCCERYLPGVQVDGHVVAYRDNATKVVAAPGPIDVDSVRSLADGALVQQWRETLTAQAGNRRIVARVDRVDLWKNIVRGFDAYELVLDRTPSIADEHWFCAIVSPPRFPNARHAEYEARCRAAESRINARFGSAGDAVTMVYPTGSENHRARAIAALSLADAVLVNPTFDGLNMVAKESLVVNPQAPLLLSRNAGAFDQLAPAAIAVDPFDVLSTADLVETALRTPPRPRDATHRACLDDLAAETARAWFDRLLSG